jgi:hypothetical protein
MNGSKHTAIEGGPLEVNHTYFLKVEEYGKVIVDGKMLAPIKRDPDFEETHGEPEIGCCVRAVFDKKLGTPRIEVIKRVAKESQIIYG